VNLDYIKKTLSANAAVIYEMVRTISAEQACWNPATDEWSILEVLQHLVDEERKDFPFRLRHLLSGTGDPWPSITPQLWVAERGCDPADLHETLEAFREERQRSLEWLSTLSHADWTLIYTHPPLDGLSAGHLLTSWATHDLLHMRQLVELKYAYGHTQFGRFGPDYAGEW
jgi:hypothetical protein